LGKENVLEGGQMTQRLEGEVVVRRRTLCRRSLCRMPFTSHYYKKWLLRRKTFRSHCI